MSGEGCATIEVVFALPHRQIVRRIPLAAGLTVREAIDRSGILREHPELGGAEVTWGVWGRPAELGQALVPGDRVEAYRPLRADPKEARRRRLKR